MANLVTGFMGAGGFNINVLNVSDFFTYDHTQGGFPASLKLFDDAANFTLFTGTGLAGSVTNDQVNYISGGTVTGIQYKDGGANVAVVTGASASALALFNDYLAANSAAFMGHIFAGNDTITGTSRADVLNGYAGNDTIKGGAGKDNLDGGAGIADKLDYSDKAASVVVNLASTTMTVGGVVEDTFKNFEGVIGGAGADTLTGNAVANTLSGGAGTVADTLNGGLGNDTLTGGLGADKFDFTTLANSATNFDTITDFVHLTDKIRVDNAVFAKLVGLGALTGVQFFSSATAVSAHDGDDRIIYNTTTGALYYDADGNKAGGVGAIKFAVLTGSPDTISAADFSII